MQPVWALADNTRRAVYDYVIARRTAVGRDQAAEALGMPRSVAAYHLDRLAEAGLLDVEFNRPAGRSGPGAGRPAKFYRRSAAEVAVHLPARDYRLAAELLARAVGNRRSARTRQAVAEEARALGIQIGGTTSRRGVSALRRLLADRGYEPFTDGTVLRLRNCPFRALVDEHRDVVCAMNHSLLSGVCEAVAGDRARARFQPAGDACCVSFGSSGDPKD